MNVLMLKGYYTPETAASLYLTENTVDALVENGINVKVCTPTPTRGITEEQRKIYTKEKKHEVLKEGLLEIKRFSMFREPRNSFMRAVRYVLCIVKQLIICLLSKSPDVYFFGSTPPINGLIMSILKKIKKSKTVYNLQDIFPDSLVHTGMTKKGSILWKIGRVVENITYKTADKIIVISQDFKKNIMEKGVPEDKIEIVYNWVDENQVVDVPRSENKLFDKYGLDRDKFYICYSGNVGFTQNMQMLVNVAKDLEDNENIGFVIVGEGAFKPKLEELVRETGLKNMTLIPFQDYSDISHVFSLGDAGLIISKKGVGSNSVPSKTWSIMSAQRPVLASFDKGSELDTIITENNCGICVNADDADALKGAILKMYEDRNSLKEMGENGREFILKNLTKEISTSKIINVLKGVL